jgi:hypothetical protein
LDPALEDPLEVPKLLARKNAFISQIVMVNLLTSTPGGDTAQRNQFKIQRSGLSPN